MAGERDLQILLRSMEPELSLAPYGFVVGDPMSGAFAVITEDEGTTVIAEAAVLRQAGYTVDTEWARISLRVHSDLAAVGLTAAFARALGDAGISANVIAGFYHDHILVQWPLREAAMDALHRLARDA